MPLHPCNAAPLYLMIPCNFINFMSCTLEEKHPCIECTLVNWQNIAQKIFYPSLSVSVYYYISETECQYVSFRRVFLRKDFRSIIIFRDRDVLFLGIILLYTHNSYCVFLDLLLYSEIQMLYLLVFSCYTFQNTDMT